MLLEGIGLLGSCLSNALAEVQQSHDIVPKSELCVSELKALDLPTSDAHFVKHAFGRAVLDSRTDGTSQNLHATLCGFSEHYNRVGGNWRIVGKTFLLQGQSAHDGTVAKQTADVAKGGSSKDTRLVSLEQTQILLLGDN